MNKENYFKNNAVLGLKYWLGMLLLLPFVVGAQSQQLDLKNAIVMAQKKSPDYKNIVNQTEGSYWRFQNYKAGLLPQLRLDATIPSYSNSVRRLTNDNGDDVFVSQNQSLFETNLSLVQNVPFTGGVFAVSSNLQRIDRYGGDGYTNYNVTPFSINYYQKSLFYNPFKWDKKIEPLMYEESKRGYIEKMEQVSMRTSRLYFGLLTAQMQLEIAEKDLSSQETLYKIAQGRFRMGKIAENELLQMELALLNSKNSVTTNIISVKRTSQNLARFLGLESEDMTLSIPETLIPFSVDVDKAVEEARENRKSVIEFRRRRLQAEQKLAEVRGSNRLEINLNANFGLSNQHEDFGQLYQNFNQQQSVTLRVGIPIFDWGVSKSRRKMAESDLALVNTNVAQDEQAFEQEIYLHVLNWSNQRDFLAIAEKAKIVAEKRYEITNKRYVLGKITITDLNLAQEEKDRSIVKYLISLQNFWNDYYTLRRLTLYDFIQNEKITLDDLVFD